MSLTLIVALNAILAAAVVAVLAYVSRIPYRLDRVALPMDLRAGIEESMSPASERAAA